jgi:hypothetical protein
MQIVLLKAATIKYLIRLLFILFSLSFAQFASAACNVGGTSYNVGGTGLISSPGAGGAITRDIIITVDTAGGDISNCDVTGITDMSKLFYGQPWSCANTQVFQCDLSARGVDQNLSTWDVSNVTNMFGMFDYADFTNGGSGSLAWSDTSSVTDMSYMFFMTNGLTSVSLLDTSNVGNMQSMFRSDYRTDLISVSLPKTGNVTNMSNMFRSSSKLTTVSLPEMGKVEDMSKMFFGASSLTSISLDDTSSVTDMSEMFSRLGVGLLFNPFGHLPPVFAQDIRNFDVTSVSNFDDMFVEATGMISKFGATANWNTTPTPAWFVPDTVAPTLSSSSPADNAIGVAVDTDITLTFTENIIAGTGNISLYDTDDNLVQAFDVASDVTLSGTTATLDPTDNLIISKRYYIQVAATAIDDAGDANSYAGISNKTALNFTPITDLTAPTVVITGPSGVVTADFTVTATFSEAVVGFSLDDITVINGNASVLDSNNAPVYTFTVTPALGTTVSVNIAANTVIDSVGNANTASNTLSIQAGSPADEFAKHKATIKNVIRGEANRSLRSGLSSDQRMMRNSKTRFIADQSKTDANQDVAFFVNGSAELKATHLDTEATAKGNFFSLQATGDGTWRKLAFGDFDVQTDDAKNVSGFLKGRMAFETNLNSTTILGYFVGGQVGRSTLKGTFEGSQNSFGASVGGYLVQTLAKDVYADMFTSLGTNRNSLKLSNGTLDLDSVYSTTTFTIGGSVTGVYDMDGFEVWPTLALNHGVTSVGDVGLTGVAYGLTDTTLSLDAGKVSLTSLSFTPEVRMPFELQEGSDSSSMATFAPRYTCEQTGNSSSRNCGSGAAIGLTTASDDGLTNLNAQFQYDKVGSTTRRSIQLGFEHRF